MIRGQAIIDYDVIDAEMTGLEEFAWEIVDKDEKPDEHPIETEVPFIPKFTKSSMFKIVGCLTDGNVEPQEKDILGNQRLAARRLAEAQLPVVPLAERDDTKAYMLAKLACYVKPTQRKDGPSVNHTAVEDHPKPSVASLASGSSVIARQGLQLHRQYLEDFLVPRQGLYAVRTPIDPTPSQEILEAHRDLQDVIKATPSQTQDKEVDI